MYTGQPSNSVYTHREITIGYRKLIDINSKGEWEKNVFEDSYLEFRMQAQYYNLQGKFATYARLIQEVAGAEKLSFLVSASIAGYMKQLKGMIPDVLNVLGKLFLSFNQYRFEIINSHMDNKKAHQVAISFYSDPLLWHDTVGDVLLVSPATIDEEKILTDMFRLQSFVTIHSLTKRTTHEFDVSVQNISF